MSRFRVADEVVAKKKKTIVISSIKKAKGSEYMDEIPEDNDKIINDEADYGRSPYSKTREFRMSIFPNPDW